MYSAINGAKQVLVTLGLCVVASQSLACSCGPGSLDRQFDGAASVFVAKIQASFDLGEELLGVNYSVERVFKGSPQYANLSTPDSGASCGVRLEEDIDYLVFARSDGRVYLCEGTTTLEQATQRGVVFALERYTSGETDSVVEPWVTHRTDRKRRSACHLSTRLPSVINEWGMFGKLTISAVFGKKSAAHELPALTIDVPPPSVEPANEISVFKADGKSHVLREVNLSERHSRFLRLESVGTHVLDIVRRLRSDSAVSVGPFQIDYERISRNPAWIERFESTANLHYIELPMENLNQGPAEFMQCLDKLQKEFDFQGKYVTVRHRQ